MKKEKLNILGICVDEDLSAKDLLGLAREELMDVETAGKVAVLREICEEFQEARQETRESITSPDQAVGLFKTKLRLLDHEECWIATLDAANHCIRVENITLGSIRTCIFDIKRIVKSALVANASGIIVAHNHPSGNPRPSGDDIKRTKSLKDALVLFDINLVDHLILSDGNYYSFAEGDIFRYSSGD